VVSCSGCFFLVRGFWIFLAIAAYIFGMYESFIHFFYELCQREDFVDTWVSYIKNISSFRNILW